MDKYNNEPGFDNDLDDGDIDFNIIFNFLNRNKKFLGKISLLFLILGSLYSFVPKKTWEGRFQIVLDDVENKKKALSNRILSTLGTGSTNNLKTEVGILKSPSVLMPVFEFMKAKKNIPEQNTHLKVGKII